MINNYLFVNDFINDYVKGAVTTTSLVGTELLVRIPIDLIPVISTIHNKSAITTIDKLIRCFKGLNIVNSDSKNNLILYKHLTYDEVRRLGEIRNVSTKSISNNVTHRNNFARTNWYKDVLNNKINYSEVLLRHRALLRKQRINMFINHLVMGRHPLVLYYYFNNTKARKYFNNKKHRIVNEEYSKFLVKNYDNDINKTVNCYNLDVNDKELMAKIKMDLKDNVMRILNNRYGGKYKDEYMHKGAEMMMQLIHGTDYTLNDLSLNSFLHCVVEIVKEYCTMNPHRNIGAILTAIFARGFFVSNFLPKDKQTRFSSEYLVSEYSIFESLPTLVELCDCEKSDLFTVAPELHIVKMYIDNYMQTLRDNECMLTMEDILK